MFRTVIHLALHFLIPAVIARWAFEKQWKRAWVIMVLTMIVDLDHLLANPIYDPNRCSIGFHPLHTWPVIIFYGILTAIPGSRVAGAGLIIHMAIDGIDCVWMRWL